nr:unnamed protein product [Spirometra erinaceieuropaei]
MQPSLLDKQVSDDCVIVIEPVPMLAACVAEESQGGRLDYVPQLTPLVLRGGVLVGGGGGGVDSDIDWKHRHAEGVGQDEAVLYAGMQEKEIIVLTAGPSMRTQDSPLDNAVCPDAVTEITEED